MQLKAILFDLDDTLIDWGHFSEHWEMIESPHLEGVYDHLCEESGQFCDLGTYKKEYFERTRNAWADARNTLVAPNLGRILVETAVALGAPEHTVEEQRCLEAYRWGAIKGTSAFPDVFEILGMLRDRGLKLGIVTNAYQPMRLRDVELKQHGLLEYFPECRFSAADIGYLKPHPDIFSTALDCLNISPREAIFIGDNPVADIAGAQSAGMRAILRVNRQAKPLLSGLVVPDAAINSLMELPAILDDWYPGWGNGAR